MYNIKPYLIITVQMILLLSCQKNEQVVAIINNKNIYQRQIDILVEDEIYKLRIQALEIFISNELINVEAKKRNISNDELRQIEIIQKSKPVFEKRV